MGPARVQLDHLLADAIPKAWSYEEPFDPAWVLDVLQQVIVIKNAYTQTAALKPPAMVAEVHTELVACLLTESIAMDHLMVALVNRDATEMLLYWDLYEVATEQREEWWKHAEEWNEIWAK